MTDFLYIDSETYSETPINNGTHAYAENAEIMLITWALGDGEVHAVDLTAGEKLPADLLDSVTLVAHNSAFDRTVSRHNGIIVPVERWHDTMVQALAHSLPGGLGPLCEALGVPTDKAKDKAGKALIHLFCKPRPKNMKLRRATSKTHPEEWKRFIEYAKLDIIAMRECHKRMPMWNYREAEMNLWRLDQRINDRGVAVDLGLAHAAIRAADREQARLAVETQDRTDGAVQAATQRDKMLAHILEAYGVILPDMTIATLERRIEDPDLPIELRELLAVRLSSSKTSASKYKRVINGVSRDGRLRGLLQFNGASRTGRWAGRLFQPQNLSRPTIAMAQIDNGIELLKADCEDLVLEDVMSLCSSAVRGVLVPARGKKFVVADLAGIENRMLAWLSGEEWKLKAFRDFDEGDGPDMYKLSYMRAFGVRIEEVTKDLRQIGKVMELMLGYEGGVGAFLTGAATYGFDIEELADKAYDTISYEIIREAEDFYNWQVKNKRSTYGLSRKAFVVCDSLKRMWRQAHPETVSWWKELKECSITAVQNPGNTITCRRHKIRCDGAWLRIMLPSGRYLCYPSPRVEDGKLTYMGINQYSRKWSRLGTYGGKLAENITQAAARDILASSMQPAEDDGFEIVLTVHDEIITEAPDTDEYDEIRLSGHMTLVPPWAQGLPLAAAGYIAYRYKKE